MTDTIKSTKSMTIRSSKLHGEFKAEAKRRGLNVYEAAIDAFTVWLEWIVEDNGAQAKDWQPVWGKDRDKPCVMQIPDRALCDDMAEQAHYFGLTLQQAIEQAVFAWAEWSKSMPDDVRVSPKGQVIRG